MSRMAKRIAWTFSTNSATCDILNKEIPPLSEWWLATQATEQFVEFRVLKNHQNV
jgi:hypothetical protein